MADQYPTTSISTVAAGKWKRPRASLTGVVSAIHKEADGDVHIRIEDGTGNFVICEQIPELPLKTLPKVGDKIVAKGIVRYDGEHGWWELHPFISWKTA